VTHRPPLLALAASLVAAAPQVARACAATPTRLPDVTPAAGGELPANVALRFDGPSYYVEVTVTVDGQPAALERASELPDLFAVDFIRVTPTPSPGQTVVIAVNFCPNNPEPCEAEFSFTVVAPDDEPPPAATDLDFGLQRYPETGGGGSCEVSNNAAWHVHFTGAGPGPGGPALHIVELAADETFSAVLAHEVVDADAGELAARVPLLLAETDAPEDYCLRVRTIDLAGNEGPPSEPVCAPSRCRSEPDDFFTDMNYENDHAEPTWTAADTCESAKGCGCAADPGAPAWLLLVPLLGLSRRRR
jgi:MYXO-CTERM domain-containing protein